VSTIIANTHNYQRQNTQKYSQM